MTRLEHAEIADALVSFLGAKPEERRARAIAFNDEITAAIRDGMSQSEVNKGVRIGNNRFAGLKALSSRRIR